MKKRKIKKPKNLNQEIQSKEIWISVGRSGQVRVVYFTERYDLVASSWDYDSRSKKFYSAIWCADEKRTPSLLKEKKQYLDWFRTILANFLICRDEWGLIDPPEDAVEFYDFYVPITQHPNPNLTPRFHPFVGNY